MITIFAASRIPSAFMAPGVVVASPMKFVAIPPRDAARPRAKFLAAGQTMGPSSGMMAGYGPPLPARSASLNPPTLVTPVANASVRSGSVNFTWTLDPSASVANLRICKGIGGAGVCHIISNDSGQTSTSVIMPAGTYYISMNSVASDGSQGQWSTDKILTVTPLGQLPGSSASPACTLPLNPRYGQQGVNDPYFTSSAARDTWVSQNPSCYVPAYVPDSLIPGLPPLPDMSSIMPYVPYAAAAAVAGLGLWWFLSQPKTASSTSGNASASASARTSGTSRTQR